MKKTLFALSIFLCFSADLFSQGAPACPSINTSGGSVCQGACVPLTASVVTNNQTTTYNVAAIPYAPYGFTGAIVLNGVDDQWAAVTPIGFNFCYYGTSYNQMVIGSNGEITFDLTQAGGYNGWVISTALPNIIDLPANTICGAFRDIDPSVGGNIYYQTVGASPCRALIVSWVNVPLFSCGAPNSTFQIVLYENTNYIDVYIQNSSGSPCAWNSGYGEIGLNNPTGTVAVVPPARNFPGTWTAINEAWRFSPAGPPSYTVNWLDASGVVGTGLNFNACPGATTTYTASMTLTNCNGSTLIVTDTAIVTIVPSAAVTVNSPTICAGSTATLTAVGGTTYTWSANAGGANTASVNVTPAVTTVYTVTTNAGGGGGCAPIAQSTVTVVPSLTVTVNVPAAICAGAATVLTAGGAATFTWTPPGGLSSVNGTTVTANPNTTTVYTVSGSSGNCPSSSATTTVTITPTSTITVNSATICPTSTGTLTANNSATYNWSPGVGLSATTGATVIANPPTTTVYTVTGAVCVSPGTCTVTVVPTCSISVNSATICPTFSANLTAVGGGPYTWSPAVGLSSTSGAVVSASPPSTTVYTVTSSSGGFSVTATATVVVNQQPTINANSITICLGIPGVLTATGTCVNYVWQPGAGLSSTTAASTSANPGTTTVYTVTGTDINGCVNTAVSIVGVNPLPTVSVTPTFSAGCTPLCVSFTGISSTSTQNCLWDFGDGNQSISCTPSPCYTIPGTYSVTMKVTDLNGCMGKANAMVVAYPVPKADFTATPQPTSILESTIQFYDLTTNAPVVKWFWNFGDWGTTDTSSLRNPKYFYKDTGVYVAELWVKTIFGCKDSTIKIIHIEDDYELFVPNAFSPNGDGRNEIFKAQGTGFLESNFHLYIYDRWGNLVFETTDVNIGWNGTRHAYGEVVQEDIYVWKILLKTTKGIKKQITGHVSLLK